MHCGHYRTAQLAVSNTRQYIHRRLRDTNQYVKYIIIFCVSEHTGNVKVSRLDCQDLSSKLS